MVVHLTVLRLMEINEAETTEQRRLHFKVSSGARLKDIKLGDVFRSASAGEGDLQPQSQGRSEVSGLSQATRQQSAPCWDKSRVRRSGPSEKAPSLAQGPPSETRGK